MAEAQRRLVFGRDRDPGVIEEAVPRGKGGQLQGNPCVIAFGAGPEGATCRTCIQLYAQPGVAGRFLKCAMRRNTSGPATDHRAGWPACAKYEPGRTP